MLVPTEVFRSHSWVALDPGLTTCGVSTFNIENEQINSIDAITLQNSHIPFNSELPVEYHRDRSIRMDKLCLAFQDILIRTNPVLVICEAPFYNPRMPGAYGSLVETVSMLKAVTANYNACIPFVMFSPQEVKQSFKRSGQKGKMVMKEALENDAFLMSKLIPHIGTLDEHSIDAVAVGYTWWLSQYGR